MPLPTALAELAALALVLRERIRANRYTLRKADRAALVRLADVIEPHLPVIPTLALPPFGPTSPGALPADPDTTSPTQPTGLDGASGADSINWTWDAAADVHDGAAAAFGVASYDLELDGVTTSVAAAEAGRVAAAWDAPDAPQLPRRLGRHPEPAGTPVPGSRVGRPVSGGVSGRVGRNAPLKPPRAEQPPDGHVSSLPPRPGHVPTYAKWIGNTWWWME